MIIQPVIRFLLYFIKKNLIHPMYYFVRNDISIKPGLITNYLLLVSYSNYMTYEDILFLIGFFLVIAFFVGCKHKPATLSGWLAFAFLSFIVTPLISVPLTWYVCRMLDRVTIKDKGYFDPSDFTFKR